MLSTTLMGTSLKLRYMALIRVTKMQNNEMSGSGAQGGPGRNREKLLASSSVCVLVTGNSATCLNLYGYPVIGICNFYIYMILS